jgi:hypothetical protein
METFKVTRVFADERGESHFEEMNYPLTDAGPIGFLSDSIKIKEVVFRKVSPTYDDFHTAPQRQYVVLLDEGVEIETSLGKKRVFAPGEVLLMEDTTGKGHRSRNIRKVERSSLFIVLEDIR